jgi:hypothetical protein
MMNIPVGGAGSRIDLCARPAAENPFPLSKPQFVSELCLENPNRNQPAQRPLPLSCANMYLSNQQQRMEQAGGGDRGWATLPPFPPGFTLTTTAATAGGRGS